MRFFQLPSGARFHTEPILTGEFREFVKVMDLAREAGSTFCVEFEPLTPVYLIEG
jgi:hypothetical protein